MGTKGLGGRPIIVGPLCGEVWRTGVLRAQRIALRHAPTQKLSEESSELWADAGVDHEPAYIRNTTNVPTLYAEKLLLGDDDFAGASQAARQIA